MRFHVTYTSAIKESEFDTDEGTTVEEVLTRVSDEITTAVNLKGDSPLPITLHITELVEQTKASSPRKPQIQHLEDGFGGRAKRPKVPKRT